MSELECGLTKLLTCPIDFVCHKMLVALLMSQGKARECPVECSNLISSSSFPELSTMCYNMSDTALSINKYHHSNPTNTLASNKSCKILGKIYYRAYNDGYFGCWSFDDIYLLFLFFFSIQRSACNWDRQCLFSLVT